jgi:hypothetical protein
VSCSVLWSDPCYRGPAVLMDVYTVLCCSIFAFMLLAFELRISLTESFIKSLFGFMYSYTGRTIFLLLYGGFRAIVPCFVSFRQYSPAALAL